MFATILVTLLSLLQPPGPGTPGSTCSAQVSRTAAEAPLESSAILRMNGYASSDLSWAVWGGEYVKCEIDAGHVESIVFTASGEALAALHDGSQIPFSLAGANSANGAWFAAYAASNGVRVVSATVPELKTGGEKGATAGLAWWQYSILWTLLASLGVAGYVRYKRFHRKARVSAVGTRESVGSGKKGTAVPETRFSDVAGCREAIEDLREIVDVLKNPDRFRQLGARAPKGALLVGPPGTGKTLLARAVAGEAGVPFFSAAGSDFVEMYVGVGARRVRDVFEKAKKAGRAIVFIDEIDAVGRRRSETATTGGETEHENTLVALLNELDGFQSSNVIVLAATNRPDVLDAALCRPGRLDRRIHVGLPDVAEREQILGVHTRNKPVAKSVDLATVARRTTGMSGAQLEHVCNEAALLAARAADSEITAPHLFEAVEYVAMGRPRRSSIVTPEDRRVTAWHEAGHTVVALKHPFADPPVAVSIVPRGQAGGVTWMAPRDSQLLSRSDLRARLVVALGGRAAEEMLLDGEHTAGAASDLAQATEIAQAMVDRFGMTDRGLSVRPLASEDSSTRVDNLLEDALREAREILLSNHELVEAVANALLERDDLAEEDLLRLAGSTDKALADS